MSGQDTLLIFIAAIKTLQSKDIEAKLSVSNNYVKTYFKGPELD